MAIGIYPHPYLPLPQVLFSSQQENSSSMTEMESGNVRTRRRFSDLKEMLDVEFKFNNEQLAFFKGWHKHVLLNGTDEFSIELPLNSSLQMFLAQIEGGGFSCDKISATHWNVSMKLNVSNTRTISETELDTILSS